uniref:Olfactory receptor n=1 Tax=Cynoglossus semilaevis TaxID=244447 RepID=A0A3P8V5Y9_CYNSE
MGGIHPLHVTYSERTHISYIIFLLILCLYVLIIVSNLLLIVVICMNRSLHEPMYLFLCSLFMNELYGATALFPFLLLHLLSDLHLVYVPLCFLQIFSIYVYGSVEFTNLAIMSYDRYLAICHPLQYNTLMTRRKVILLVAGIWFPPAAAVLVTTCLTSSLRLCRDVIEKVYCDNYTVIKLSCGDTRVNNVYELIACLFTVFAPMSVIVFSYVKIFKVCFSGSKQSRQKALSTCSPQLASLINFSFGVCFEVFQSRFDMSNVPNILRVFLSSYFLTCQPLFNPVMYGLILPKIRHLCKHMLLRKCGTKQTLKILT